MTLRLCEGRYIQIVLAWRGVQDRAHIWVEAALCYRGRVQLLAHAPDGYPFQYVMFADVVRTVEDDVLVLVDCDDRRTALSFMCQACAGNLRRYIVGAYERGDFDSN